MAEAIVSGICAPDTKGLGVEIGMTVVKDYYNDGSVIETLYGGHQEEINIIKRTSTMVERSMVTDWFEQESE